MTPQSHKPSRGAAAVELLVVLLVLWLPLFAGSLAHRVNPQPPSISSESFSLLWDAGAIVLLFFLVWRNGERVRVLGFRRMRWWTELLWAFAVYAATWLAWLSLVKLASAIGWTGASPPPEETPSRLYRALLPGFLLVSAFFEELLMRAYLWHRLAQVTGRKDLALVVSSLLFAAFHPYALLELLGLFVSGLVMGLVYWHSRRLPRLVLAHWAVNLTIIYGYA